MTVGRVSESKHLLEMLPVLDVLTEQGKAFSLDIIGAPLTPRDEEYKRAFEKEVVTRAYASSVRLLGAINHDDLAAHLAKVDVALNFATTGNMDKAGLEALAAGVPLVTTNRAFEALGGVPGVLLVSADPHALAEAIASAVGSNAVEAAALVRREHSLAALIPRILAILGHD